MLDDLSLTGGLVVALIVGILVGRYFDFSIVSLMMSMLIGVLCGILSSRLGSKLNIIVEVKKFRQEHGNKTLSNRLPEHDQESVR